MLIPEEYEGVHAHPWGLDGYTILPDAYEEITDAIDKFNMQSEVMGREMDIEDTQEEIKDARQDMREGEIREIEPPEFDNLTEQAMRERDAFEERLEQEEEYKRRQGKNWFS